MRVLHGIIWAFIALTLMPREPDLGLPRRAELFAPVRAAIWQELSSVKAELASASVAVKKPGAVR